MYACNKTQRTLILILIYKLHFLDLFIEFTL